MRPVLLSGRERANHLGRHLQAEDPTPIVPPGVVVTPDSEPPPAQDVPTSTPGSVPVGSPTPFTYAPAPLAAEDAALTPQTVTGTVYLATSGPIYVTPTVTADAAGAMLAVVFVYILLWRFMASDARIVVGGAGLVACALVVLSGSPQWVLGFVFLSVGLLFVELLGNVLPKRMR